MKYQPFTSIFKVQYAKEVGFVPMPKQGDWNSSQFMNAPGHPASAITSFGGFGNRPSHSVKKRVRNLEYDKEGTVEEDLSTQYTVNYDDGSFGFLIKRDKDTTWKEIDDDTSTSE